MSSELSSVCLVKAHGSREVVEQNVVSPIGGNERFQNVSAECTGMENQGESQVLAVNRVDVS